MKNSKKNLSTGQSTRDVKKPHKHDANLQKNSTLYFQIGLILCLLATYSLFEMQFQEKKIVIVEEDYDGEYVMAIPPDFRIAETKPKESQPKRDQQRIIDVVKVVEDFPLDNTEKDLFTEDQPLITDKPTIKAENAPEPESPKAELLVPITLVQKVPVYPGCEKYETNNDKLKKCMSTKISKLINRKFNTDLASDHGLSGKQKIYATFTIDKTGKITKIATRAPHSALEKEAQRVINKIPEMKPGEQQNKPVGVTYSLPIVFQVRD